MLVFRISDEKSFHVILSIVLGITRGPSFESVLKNRNKKPKTTQNIEISATNEMKIFSFLINQE